METCENCAYRQSAPQWQRILWRNAEDGQKSRLKRRKYLCSKSCDKVQLTHSCDSWLTLSKGIMQLELIPEKGGTIR